MFQNDKAYSLLELVMTLALVSIVLTLGVPSLGKLVADHRMRTDADRLFHAIHLARKESVVRRRVVTLCPSNDGLSCEPSFDWSMGFMMFVNRDRSQPLVRENDEPVLIWHRGNGHNQIVANRQGFSLRSTELRATNGTIIICDPESRAEARAVVVSYTGRPRVTRKDRRGRPYECAR